MFRFIGSVFVFLTLGTGSGYADDYPVCLIVSPQATVVVPTAYSDTIARTCINNHFRQVGLSTPEIIFLPEIEARAMVEIGKANAMLLELDKSSDSGLLVGVGLSKYAQISPDHVLHSKLVVSSGYREIARLVGEADSGRIRSISSVGDQSLIEPYGSLDFAALKQNTEMSAQHFHFVRFDCE